MGCAPNTVDRCPHDDRNRPYRLHRSSEQQFFPSFAKDDIKPFSFLLFQKLITLLGPLNGAEVSYRKSSPSSIDCASCIENFDPAARGNFEILELSGF